MSPTLHFYSTTLRVRKTYIKLYKKAKLHVLVYKKLQTLWEEETRNPKRLGLSLFDPVVNEGTSEDEIGNPGAERLERRVCSICPQLRHVVVEERRVDHLELLTHNHETFDRLLQLLQ